jgi:hypothetical protein
MVSQPHLKAKRRNRPSQYIVLPLEMNLCSEVKPSEKGQVTQLMNAQERRCATRERKNVNEHEADIISQFWKTTLEINCILFDAT